MIKNKRIFAVIIGTAIVGIAIVSLFFREAFTRHQSTSNDAGYNSTIELGINDTSDNNKKQMGNGAKKEGELSPDTGIYIDMDKENNTGAKSIDMGPASANSKEQKDQITAKDLSKYQSSELEAEIVGKYVSRLVDLRSSSLSQLDALFAQAADEYRQLPEAKKKTAKLTLGVKYLALGKKLESECDAKFNSILKEMEKELKAHNLPTNSVKDAKAQYAAEKKEKYNYLMSKVF